MFLLEENGFWHCLLLSTPVTVGEPTLVTMMFFFAGILGRSTVRPHIPLVCECLCGQDFVFLLGVGGLDVARWYAARHP